MAAITPSVTEQVMSLLTALQSCLVPDPLPLYLAFQAMSQSAEVFEQTDISEFLHFVLDRMHSEFFTSFQPSRRLASVTFTDSSLWTEIFRSTLITRNFCHSNCLPVMTPTPAIEISLDIPILRIPLIGRKTRKFLPVPFNLEDLIAGFCEPRSHACSRCGMEGGSETYFGSFPETLVINLGRAKFDMDNGSSKNRAFVEIPEKLDISQFHGIDPSAPTVSPAPYSLNAFVIHHGRGSDSGHYTSVTNRQGEWWRFNDMEISKLKSVRSLLDSLSGLSHPCLLFYSRTIDELNSKRRKIF